MPLAMFCTVCLTGAKGARSREMAFERDATDRRASALDGLSDDVVLRLFARAPFTTHGTLHVVCRRLKSLLRSPIFQQQRVASGLAEHGLVVAAGLRYDDRSTGESLMLASGRWRPIARMRVPRFQACSAVMANEDGQPEMWVMGGLDDGQPEKWYSPAHHANVMATVEAYNPRTNAWRSLPPLAHRRHGAVAGVVGGRVVVAGGFGAGGHDHRSVEAYTPNGWVALPDLPYAAWEAAACVLDGRLYVMGGMGSKKLQVLELTEEDRFVWTVKGDQLFKKVVRREKWSWTVKADLPAVRREASCAVHDGKIWLVAGFAADDGQGKTNSAVIYDPASNTWAAGPPVPIPRVVMLNRPRRLTGLGLRSAAVPRLILRNQPSRAVGHNWVNDVTAATVDGKILVAAGDDEKAWVYNREGGAGEFAGGEWAGLLLDKRPIVLRHTHASLFLG